MTDLPIPNRVTQVLIAPEKSLAPTTWYVPLACTPLHPHPHSSTTLIPPHPHPHPHPHPPTPDTHHPHSIASLFSSLDLIAPPSLRWCVTPQQYFDWNLNKTLTYDSHVHNRPIEWLSQHGVEWYCWFLTYKLNIPNLACDQAPAPSPGPPLDPSLFSTPP